MFIYKAIRHPLNTEVEVRFDTLDEAIRRAREDYRQDTAFPKEIADFESGETILGVAGIGRLLSGLPVSIGWTENGQQFTVS